MKNFQQGTKIAALGLAAALALAGCASGAGDSPAASTSDAGGSFDFYAAASLTDVAPNLVDAYNAGHDPDINVSLNFGASSKLVGQINGGEKPGVLITADTQSIEALERPAEFNREADVAANNLVLVVPADSGITTVQDLAKAKTLAVCAPAVPCGRAANKYLATQKDLAAQMSEEADVRSVLTKVTSGQVDAGFVYATDAASAGDTVRSIALTGLAPNLYPLLVNKEADAAARDFAAWLHTEAAQDVLRKAGFDTP